MTQAINELVHFINQYIEKRLLQDVDYSKPVRRNDTPDALKKKLHLAVSKKGIDEKELLAAIRQVIDNSVQFDHPLFLNQMFGRTQDIGLLADLIIPLLNTSIYTYEVAPAMTLIENEIIAQLTKIVWGKSGDGVFTSGGSMSNMNALFLARANYDKKTKKQGLFDKKPYSIFVSDQAHYSFTKGVNYLGFGLDSLVKIPSDKYARIQTYAIEEAIEHEIAKGRVPLMLIGIAGTTISGHFDDLEKLAEIAKKHKLWFHVDAAFGGSFMFSEKLKHKLKGIEYADSITWNFHKVMGMTLTAASFLTRKKGLLKQSFSVDAQYLFKDNFDAYNLGQKSLQGGRRPDAFKLWLTWKYKGDEGFAKHVEDLHKVSHQFADIVQKEKDFELFDRPDSAIVCFRYIPKDKSDQELNDLNIKIREKIINQGNMVFNYSYLNNTVYLRCVFLDPEISTENLKYIMDSIVDTSKDL